MSRLEQRVDNIERGLERVNDVVSDLEQSLNGLRSESDGYRAESHAMEERILAAVDDLARRPSVFL